MPKTSPRSTRSQRLRWPKTRPAEGFRGLYINLDRDRRRRNLIEAQIRELGWDKAYLRLPAVDGRQIRSGKSGITSAAIGCFRSHQQALLLAADARMPVHIVEDDAQLTPHVGRFAGFAEASGLLDANDIVFLDMWVDPHWSEFTAYEDLYRKATSDFVRSGGDYGTLALRDLKNTRIGTTRSYLVNPRGAEKVASLLLPSDGIATAVDNRLHRLVQDGRIKAGVVVPFLTAGDLETGTSSHIQNVGKEQLTVFELFRMAFTVDVDPPAEIFPLLDRLRATRRYPGLDEFRHLIATRRP